MHCSKNSFNKLISLAIVVLLLFLCMGVARAQSADSLQLQKLRKEMYYHYSKRHTKEFFETTDHLKQLALKLGKKDEYYKAYGNQAIYTSTNINRTQAVGLAKKIYEQADREQSMYGLYTANYVLGTIFSSMAQLDEAISHYQDALNILKRYYPKENLSALYLAMARVERGRKNTDKVEEYVDYVLADSKATNLHRMSAMSYRYMIQMDRHAGIAVRDHVYQEREKMKAVLGHDDNFGYIIEYDQALIHGKYDLCKNIIDSLITNAETKARYSARLSYAMGDYKTAYVQLLRYKRLCDSANNDKVRKQSYDMGIMLDKERAENEAKDLRLSNQALEMSRIAGELKRRQLEKDALNMSLQVQLSRLDEMEAQRQNDSLMAGNKELQISEFHTKMKAYENEKRSRRNKQIAAAILAGLTFCFIGIYAYSRRQQLRRLKEAYDKLEETTTAKERIESELRIARDIQMSMLPHDPPKYKGLDLYAFMKPAKEVGGDLYDFSIIDDKIYFCVGDVSGKGVPASLFMAQTLRLFRALAKQRHMPAKIATMLNDELTENNDNGMFVTMFIGMLDLKTGRLDFCNAGHNPPILDGQFIEMESNAPLGLWEGLEYQGESLGDITAKRLFIYSDGLNEAENMVQDQYGDDKLLAFTRIHADVDCHTLIDLIEQDLEKHVNGAAPSDDLTMLCIRRDRTTI